MQLKVKNFMGISAFRYDGSKLKLPLAPFIWGVNSLISLGRLAYYGSSIALRGGDDQQREACDEAVREIAMPLTAVKYRYLLGNNFSLVYKISKDLDGENASALVKHLLFNILMDDTQEVQNKVKMLDNALRYLGERKAKIFVEQCHNIVLNDDMMDQVGEQATKLVKEVVKSVSDYHYGLFSNDKLFSTELWLRALVPFIDPNQLLKFSDALWHCKSTYLFPIPSKEIAVLSVALYYDFKELTSDLIKAGANTYSKDNNEGRTPLMYAFSCLQSRSLPIILKARAEHNRIDGLNIEGEAPAIKDLLSEAIRLKLLTSEELSEIKKLNRNNPRWGLIGEDGIDEKEEVIVSSPWLQEEEKRRGIQGITPQNFIR
jgi:hypothetical protein